MKTLSVWWEQRLVGSLQVTPLGNLSFTYAPSWLEDPTSLRLSASLPKRMAPFGQHECRPFFAGLLPEEAQREMIARQLGISRGNVFGLLDALGRDVAGALSFWPPDQSPEPIHEREVQELDDAGLIALLASLPTRPFMVGDGLRLSLAGAQSKMPVVIRHGRIALPAPGMPTTHILKPPIPGFAGITENEAFALRLAHAVGLDAASVNAHALHEHRFLLIERYDRITDARGTRRLHQEDFCQALGIDSERKYASEGGPTFKTCFELIRRVSTQPAVDALKLLDAAIFNVVIGNADAHGKNFSLLYGPTGTTLAPLYDLLSTINYPALSASWAMRIGRCSRLEDLDANAWKRFAGDADMSAPYVQRRIVHVADAVIDRARKVIDPLIAQGLSDEHLSPLATLVMQRAERAAQQGLVRRYGRDIEDSDARAVDPLGD